MKKLSTGEDSTLGNWRKLAVSYLGEDSPAVEFIDKKIIEAGSETEVLANEAELVRTLLVIHNGLGRDESHTD